LNYAIIFSVENKQGADVEIGADGSSGYEKMAIGLAYTIRLQMPEVDVYCGSFTNNQLSNEAQKHFNNLNVKIISTNDFLNLGKDDSYMFLRTYTKDFFAKKILKNYDFLLYVDVDTVFLNPVNFNFDPTEKIILTETMPNWVKNYHKEFLQGFHGNLYYNWVDIINHHNSHIFDFNWNEDEIKLHHMADRLVSERIAKSNLTKIEQNFGGYHFIKELNKDSIIYHYDSFDSSGSLYNLKKYHSLNYRKYLFIFEKILDVKINNQENYWENLSLEFM